MTPQLIAKKVVARSYVSTSTGKMERTFSILEPNENPRNQAVYSVIGLLSTDKHLINDKTKVCCIKGQGVIIKRD